MFDAQEEKAQKVHEDRLRRMAARQGLRASKTRTRDRRAVDYGRWYVSDETNMVVAELANSDELERFLTQ